MQKHVWPLTVLVMAGIIAVLAGTVRSQAKTIHDWRLLLWAENEQLQMVFTGKTEMTEQEYLGCMKTIADVRTRLASKDFHPEAMQQGAGSEKGEFQR